jgi:hypothetical protein
MTAATIARIYTEAKNKRRVIGLVSARFESFTVQPTDGYYRGKRESALVIEIVGATGRQVASLARRIRSLNGQKSVLILRTRGNSQLTR